MNPQLLNDSILAQGEAWKAGLAQVAQTATAIVEPTPFMRRASILIERNIPIAPLPPMMKFAPPTAWERLATTDITKLAAMNPHPNGNTAAVAHAEIGGFCFFEVDRANFHTEIEKQTGQKFPETFLVSSTPGKGKGHFYLRHTPKSIAFQKSDGRAYVNSKDADGEIYSFRMDASYVVGPLSVKLDGSGQSITYTIIKNTPIADCPDWLIDWIAANNKSEASPLTANVDGTKIPRGAHDTTLTRIAGKLRQDGLEEEAIYNALVEVCEKRCENYDPSDYKQMCRKIAHSVCRYPVKEAGPVIMGGNVLGQPQAQAAPDLSWLDLSEAAARPEFPSWIMRDTSLYTGLAKPVSDVNSKFPELIWLPAVQVMMNYLYNRVGIKGMRTHTNMFLGIISSPGKFFKSSSCKLAHEYFGHMGLVKSLTPGLRNADGTVVIGQAGSSEGFGLQASRVNAKHGIMFNGELGKMVSKAGIENSSLPHDLLLWYESEDFSNLIKSAKQSFAFPAGTYCFGWQFCTTVRGFNSQWSRVAGVASGMPDRFFFLVTPEEPKELKHEVFVNTLEGAIKTKRLIDEAAAESGVSTDGVVKLHEYEIDEEAADKLLKRSAAFGDPRSMNMVYKFALYFAIDLGLDSISDDCISRALALVEYRQKAIAFLQPIEARNDEGRLLQEMLREIQQHGGKMSRRVFLQNMSQSQYGDRFWSTVYYGAIKADHFREFTEPGARGQTRKMIGLVKDDVRFGPE